MNSLLRVPFCRPSRILIFALPISATLLYLGGRRFLARHWKNRFDLQHSSAGFESTARGEVKFSSSDVTEFVFSALSARPCEASALSLLIVVHSLPSHFVHRNVIRHTWGSKAFLEQHGFRLLFLVGVTEHRVQVRLSHEMVEHGDVVQGTFWDSYRNLTFKHLMGYKWILSFCPMAKVILKTDDDVFVDMFRVVSLLSQIFGMNPNNLLACWVVPAGSSPYRKGKWAVLKTEYPALTYPEYCSGAAYLASIDLVSAIYEAAEHVPFFWIDDVYMTGLVADFVHARRLSLSVWFARSESLLLSWGEGNSSRPCPWLVGELTSKHWPWTVIKLWQKTENAWKLRNYNPVEHYSFLPP